jgi:hypothetical protein
MPTCSRRLARGTRLLSVLLAVVHVFATGVARFAERVDSNVAAVHVEQAGTSAHHGHANWCAVCTASHLVAPPLRAHPFDLAIGSGASEPRGPAPGARAAATRHHRSRAPPA